MNATLRRSLPPLAAAVAAVALLAGCGSTSTTATSSTPAAPSATSPGAMGPAVPSPSPSAVGLQRVGVADFATAVGQPGVVVLDVRTPAEFAAGHLDKAVNIDVESSDFTARIGELDKGTTYAVYCRSGNRSRAATQAMQQMGFTSLYDLDGGINDWAAAGQPVVS